MIFLAAVTPHFRALNISIGAPMASPIAYTFGINVSIRRSTTMAPASSLLRPGSASSTQPVLGASPVPTKTKSVPRVTVSPDLSRTTTSETVP